MKRLIEIATGRACGDYPDDYQPPAGSVDANPSLYRFEPIPQSELDAEQRARRARVIRSQLADIDRRSIRPAREGDTARLAALESEAKALRAELGSLA